MNEIVERPLNELGKSFVPSQYSDTAGLEYEIRQSQQLRENTFRALTDKEISILASNDNNAEDWSKVEVSSSFDPDLVQACRFFGLVRIGNLEPIYLQFHDLQIPVGLYNSVIVSCDIGNNAAVHNVRYLANYIIDRRVIIINVDEMQTTNYAKFGNGVLKEGEPEEVRVWLEICNETGSRKILPFDGMLPADAFLWTKYRDDEALMKKFTAMTQSLDDGRRGKYGTVGECTVIKHCRIIKDTKIGSHAYLKGANKLKNLTVNSSAEESTQIGEGVELVNGIIGYGCHIFYGVKAVRFILGTGSSLKYGARLINSYLGDNSTISCCEVLNSLIFCSHEQHHNNSFLTAALVHGQTNIAAGVTAGSNHSSRAADGEFVARRGFWPGLCTNFKHNSRLASFVLVANGSYNHELDIPLPFSLVSLSDSKNSVQILPGYWFLYNMYALMRNTMKWHSRDQRIHREQNFEFDCLAPDTVNEMLAGLKILERQAGRAWLLREKKEPSGLADDEVRRHGMHLLTEEPEIVESLQILGEGMENSIRKVRIIKADKGYAIYREMISYYCVKTILQTAENAGLAKISDVKPYLTEQRDLEGPPTGEWINMGGQLVRERDLKELKSRIARGEITSWKDLHAEYQELWGRYPKDKAVHAYQALLELLGKRELSDEEWKDVLLTAKATREKIVKLTRESREKDYTNPFRSVTFDSHGEMLAVLGSLEENDFIKQTGEESLLFCRSIEKYSK